MDPTIAVHQRPRDAVHISRDAATPSRISLGLLAHAMERLGVLLHKVDALRRAAATTKASLALAGQCSPAALGRQVKARGQEQAEASQMPPPRATAPQRSVPPSPPQEQRTFLVGSGLASSSACLTMKPVSTSPALKASFSRMSRWKGAVVGTPAITISCGTADQGAKCTEQFDQGGPSSVTSPLLFGLLHAGAPPCRLGV
jgi:hypothetical protein